jgi:hypothetical protein
MLIILASLGLIRCHRLLGVATSTNHRIRTAPPSSAATPTLKERRHSNAF